MEFPHMGKHCSNLNCNKLDFLPIKCDACSELFCEEHYSYTRHSCPRAYQKDNQVPVCPLCNKPVPVAAGEEPNFVVGAHIDNDCQSDLATKNKKVFTNRCSMKGCKVKEVIPVVCNDCTLNFCLKHRHPQDHKCGGKQVATRQKALNAALSRRNRPANQPILNGDLVRLSSVKAIFSDHGCTDLRGVLEYIKAKGGESEDEALARALALSMQPMLQPQEDLDLALARQLQASEYHATTAAASRTSTRDRCSVV